MREWLRGGVQPCQGWGRGFESRLALLLLKRTLHAESFFLHLNSVCLILGLIFLYRLIIRKECLMKIKKRFSSLGAIAVLTVCSVLFSGCMTVDHENRSTFELREDGSVTQTIVDDSDGSVTGEELENYINESITQFQNTNSGESVALETCRVSSGKVNITLVYSSASAYAAFNNVSCFNGTLKEAYDAGYDLNRSFYFDNGVSVPYFELPRYCYGSRVLILEEAVDVTIPGELQIVSAGITVGADGSISVDENPDDGYSEEFQASTASAVVLIYSAE